MFGSKKKYSEYKVISEQELNDNHDVELIETISEQGVHYIPTTAGPTREHVLTKVRYLVGVKRDKHIADLKKQLRVGVKNYVEYENLKTKNEILKTEVESKDKDIHRLTEVKDDLSARLTYLRKHLGTDAFGTLMNEFEHEKKAKEKRFNQNNQSEKKIISPSGTSKIVKPQRQGPSSQG